MNPITWLGERFTDAFANHPAAVVYLVLTMTVLIILIYDLYRMKTNQINRQVSTRIGKEDKEKKELHIGIIEKFFEKQEDKIKTILVRANVLFTPKEFLTFMTIGSIVGFIVGAVLFPLGTVWKSLFSFLPFLLTQDIFGRLLAGVVLGFAGSYFPYIWVKMLEKKRHKLMNEQIQESLLNIADALKSGHVINDAIKIVGDEMPYPMGNEFNTAHKEMEAGKTLKDALYDLKVRVNIEDFTMALNAMEIQYEVGGELEPLLRKMVGVVQERQELKQEVRKTIANAKTTGIILAVAPAGFLGIFVIMDPSQYQVMFTTPIGWMLLAGALVTYAIGLGIIYTIIRSVTKEI